MTAKPKIVREPAPAAPLPAQLDVPETCGNCRWWQAFPNMPIGACYRFPPQIVPGLGPAGVRPQLLAEEMGCGEHEERIAEAARPVGFAAGREKAA